VQPLNAEINTNYTNGTAPHTIQFKAKATGGNQPYSFSWNFDDGSNKIDNAEIISHTFSKPGNYNVILTVTDSNQDHQTASRLVTLRQTTANVNNKPLTAGSFYNNENKTQNTISLDNGVNSPAHTQQLKNQGIANSTTTIMNTRTTTGVTKVQNPLTFNNATKSIISNSSPANANNVPGNNNPILKLTNNQSLTTINANQHPNNTKYQTQISSINNTSQHPYPDQKQSSTTASPSSTTSNAVQRYPFRYAPQQPQQQQQNQPQTLLPPQQPQQQQQNQPQTLLPPQQPQQNQQPQTQQRINQQPPIANAGISQTVYGGTIVTLDGRSSYDPDNYAAGGYANNYINNYGIAAYEWTQIPATTNSGVQISTVILRGANTANPTFVAPILPYDTILAFSLKVMDSDGRAISSNPAIVYVYVKHNPNNSSPTTGDNTPGITVNPQETQQQQPQPLVPNNNLVPAAPSQPNTPSPTFPPPAPQIGSLNSQNRFPLGR
jgi:hypothetical protein